jgi:hypothetical protein
MHLPTQSRPAVRNTRRRPWRDRDPRQLGLVPLEADEEYESGETDDVDESVQDE